MRHSAAVIVNAPEGEVISLAEASDHLRVDRADESNDIRTKLEAAVETAQDFTGRKLLTQTWNIFWDRFPCSSCEPLLIPFGQLDSVEKLEYRKTDGTWVELVVNTDIVVDNAQEPARILPAYGKTWPAAQLAPGSSIKAEIVCGYGESADVPATIKAAILLQLGHLYSHRESVTVGNSSNIESKELALGFANLLSGYRLWAF